MVVVSYLELRQDFSKDAKMSHVAGSAVPVLISAPAAQQTDARYEASVTFVSAEYLEDEITTLKDELEDLTSMSKDDHKVVWAKVNPTSD